MSFLTAPNTAQCQPVPQFPHSKVEVNTPVLFLFCLAHASSDARSPWHSRKGCQQLICSVSQGCERSLFAQHAPPVLSPAGLLPKYEVLTPLREL